MIDDMTNELDRLLFSEDGFLIKLRLGDGFQEDKYELICRTIEDISHELKGCDQIPKRLVNILYDISKGIESACNLYNDQEIQKILQSADEVSDIIRGCFI